MFRLIRNSTHDFWMTVAAMRDVVASVEILDTVHVEEAGSRPADDVERTGVPIGHRARRAHVRIAHVLHLLRAPAQIMTKNGL